MDKPIAEDGKLGLHVHESGTATIWVSSHPEAWLAVQREVLAHVTHYHLVGGTSIELPFWELIPLLPRIQNVRSLFPELVIVVDKRTADLIKRTHRAGQEIEDVARTAPVSEMDVKRVLNEVGFRRQLTSEQLRNVCRLVALPHGATFSVPGAGKTTEALAFYAYKTRLEARLLVVCPKNAFPAWEEQVAICLPGKTVTRLVGADRISTLLAANPEIAVITYSQLNLVTNAVARYLGNQTSMMFLDESHKIKGGEQRAWASAALAVSHLPQWKLIMSGTPMPNDPSDLLPQLRFLYPNLPPDIDPIPAMQRVYVRTTKAELRLPEVKSHGTPIPLTDAQAHLYRLCATEVARDGEKALRSQDRNALRAFGRSYMLLLQIVSNPSLLAPYGGRFQSADLIQCLQSDSPKIAYACYRARELAAKGHKSIIWSGFVQNVEIIAERLADLGADYIHGEVEAGSEEEEHTREGKIRRFRKDDDSMVLVANPAACSEGISLHSICHHALYVDRNYNAAQFLQSQDRIHRLGLEPGTLTYIEYLYSPGTIDDSVIRRLGFKIQQMETALRDPSINLPTHWRDDLDELPDGEDIRDLLQTLRGNAV